MHFQEIAICLSNFFSRLECSYWWVMVESPCRSSKDLFKLSAQEVINKRVMYRFFTNLTFGIDL